MLLSIIPFIIPCIDPFVKVIHAVSTEAPKGPCIKPKRAYSDYATGGGQK
jgi:hypothetical protein